MRLLLYPFMLLLLAGQAAAGPGTGAGRARRPTHPYLAADTTAPPLDTTRVLQQLFAHKRKVYRTQPLSAGVAALALNYSLAYAKSETTFQQAGRGLIAAYIGFYTYRFGRAVVQLRRYRVGREQTLLAALAHGQPLPRPVRRQLLAYLRPVPAKQ